MFTKHSLNTEYRYTRHLILLFLVIVIGLGSVLTRGAGITIQSNLDNNKAVMKQIKVTNNGLDAGVGVFSADGITNTIAMNGTNISINGTTNTIGEVNKEVNIKGQISIIPTDPESLKINTSNLGMVDSSIISQ